MGRYLVTGGAGFVGSHLVAALLDAGHACVVIDNLSTGHRGAVLRGATLVQADIADRDALDEVLGGGGFHAVFHFAARSLVAESMRDPLGYIDANLVGSLRLIEACVRHGISRFVFSSTAALFGEGGAGPIDEATPIRPVSPYGESKWMVERALHWAGVAHGLHSACLRYFNAAGADEEGRLGEDHAPETHLIPLAIDAALHGRAELQIYGQDYPTPDGSCIRDYIHVADLAAAHLAVLPQLDAGSVAYNLGNGRGHSVLEVIRVVEQLTGRRVPVRPAARRMGDPASLVASAGRITSAIGWVPRRGNLDTIVRSALSWRSRNPEGYGSAR